ncbi:MAG: hypothetical protein ACI9W4_000411 [Rhodothermales bacterium]|jgi:hypothetical protein
MMKKVPDLSEPRLTDQDIDHLIRKVVQSEPAERPQPDPGSGHYAGIWYLAVFLLGMTAMEGLRVMIPPLQEVRGSMLHRCGGLDSPNPAEPGAVAWDPE